MDPRFHRSYIRVYHVASPCAAPPLPRPYPLPRKLPGAGSAGSCAAGFPRTHSIKRDDARGRVLLRVVQVVQVLRVRLVDERLRGRLRDVPSEGHGTWTSAMENDGTNLGTSVSLRSSPQRATARRTGNVFLNRHFKVLLHPILDPILPHPILKSGVITRIRV